jgi:hypothetical protein
MEEQGTCIQGRSAMSHAGWSEIWKLALSQFGTETIQFRIFVGLGIAFVALMIVEGLRVSFVTGHHLPARQSSAVEIQPRKKPFKKTAVAATQSFQASSGPFRPRALGRTNNPKRTNGRISLHRAARPKIRRIYGELAASAQPTFTEEAAPFSPLPPIPGRIEV